METLNQKRDSWTAWIFFVSLLFVASTMLVGCGKDSKKGGGTVAVAPTNNNNGRITHPNCSNCSNYTDQLVTAANSSMDNSVDFAIALYSPSYSGSGHYSGAVDVSGYIEVFSTPITECPFYTGFYQLRVANPNGTYADNRSGTWNLTGLRFEGIHDNGAVVEFQIPYMEFQDAQTVIGADGYEYHATISTGELHVLSADGYQCGFPQYGTPRKIFFTLK